MANESRQGLTFESTVSQERALLVVGRDADREVAKFLTLIRSPANETYERDVN